MKERILRALGNIIPTLMLIILTPISVVFAPIHWLYKTIRRFFQR